MADDDPLEGVPWAHQTDAAFAAVWANWRRQREQTSRAATSALNLNATLTMSGSLEAVKIPGPSAEQSGATLTALPDILLQATVTFGDRSHEGQLVTAVAIPWFEIIRQIERDPDFMFKVPWRKLEEIIAGAFRRDGYPDVILTPPSGDGGRDIIATRPGIGSVRIFGQVKAYKPGHLVKAEEVRAMLGVLEGENVSKGLVTTTSDFAPRLPEDAHLKRFMPYRLELMNGERLLAWLTDVAANKQDTN